MRLLHVYAGPFPTTQGTQTLVHQICQLLTEEGHEVHLLCYHGRQFERPTNYQVHRIADRPKFNVLRSGPRWQKPILDAALAARAVSLAGSLRPDILAGHHVEGLLAAKPAAGRFKIPLVYHLHALLAPELPTYYPALAAPAARLAGAAADRLCCTLAAHTIALSNAQAHGAPTSRLTVVPPPLCPGDLSARPTLAPETDRVITGAYVGNLDAYQNIETLVQALGIALPRLERQLRFEFITDSDPGPIRSQLGRIGLEQHVSFYPHGDYSSALARLLKADFTVIPRVQVGGVPIKLVTALALGLPTIVHSDLAEGLRDQKEALLVDGSSTVLLAEGLEQLTRDPDLRTRLRAGARPAAQRLFDPKLTAKKLLEAYTAACLCA